MKEDLKQCVSKYHKLGQGVKDSHIARDDWDGFYTILTDLYPDNAHFIFELLQNAEDAVANKVKFELNNEALIFKHDGSRDFNADDINSITSIGKSNKDENQIGEFGIGFKSVFSYTTSPKIHSKDISFKIEDLIVPSLIDSKEVEEGYSTLFIFPFDRQDKPKKQAVKEIMTLFKELSDTVLLFLRNINSIEWVVNNSKPKRITKTYKNEFFEINNTQKGKSNWLVYRDKIKINSHDKPLTVSVAFSLDKNKKEIIETKGEVSIFFPAKKETSNLRFHIDAPFASTVARDSIGEGDGNNEILANIAQLCAKSVHEIKDLGFLKMSFFEILPNKDDNLASFYKPIYTALKEEFESPNNELIPLEKNLFSSLENCLYVSRQVKDTFSNVDDINAVFDDDNLFGFAKNPRKHTNTDKFISALEGASVYSDDEVYDVLSVFAKVFYQFTKYNELYRWKYSEQDRETISKKQEWLESKSDAWLQSFYAFLDDTYDDSLKYFIKLADGSFNFHNEDLYFPEENITIDAEFCFVDDKTYTSGNNEKQQEKAKSFLESQGVESIDESTYIKLKFDDYEFVSEDEYLKDINRLVAFYIDNKHQTIDILGTPHYGHYKEAFILSKDYWKYLVQEGEDEDAYENKPLLCVEDVFIDLPYEDTGMSLIYGQLDYVLYDLHEIHQDLENLEAFLQLLKDLGAYSELKIKNQGVWSGNPEYDNMHEEARGAEYRHETGTSRDWTIDHLEDILKLQKKRLEISKLLWNRLNSAEKTNFTACYRKNSRDNAVYRDSLLTYTLKKYEWIPDKEGVFHKPTEISKEILHPDFVYDNSNGWLDAVEFGKNILQQQEEYQEKKAVFEDVGMTAEQAAKYKKLGSPSEAFDAFLKEEERKKLDNSMRNDQGSGETSEVAQPQDLGSIITNPDINQENINKENRGIPIETPPITYSPNPQDQAKTKEIRDYLYNQYSGHCQICGDTFKGNKDRNIFLLYSLNRSKKGDRLISDVNRKGNSLSLCPKHHKMLALGLQKFSFINKFDSSELSLPSIIEFFGDSEVVGKDDVFELNDGFYNKPEGTPFEVDSYLLPIKLHKKTLHIKFTLDHIQNFIAVWNNN